MKFRERKDTHYIYVHLRDTKGLTVPELHNEARRAGELTLGYHYVVQDNGDVEQGRDQYSVAGRNMEDAETSIYVLINSRGKNKLSDCQVDTVKDLLDLLQTEYPKAKIIKE